MIPPCLLYQRNQAGFTVTLTVGNLKPSGESSKEVLALLNSASQTLKASFHFPSLPDFVLLIFSSQTIFPLRNTTIHYDQQSF